MISCKVDLKIKWTKYCIFSAAGNDNDKDRDDKVVFTTKETKLYVSVLTLSARDNQKRLSKGFERSVY